MATTGSKLKQSLGLQEFPNVYISKAVVRSAINVFFVFYDSRKPNIGISSGRALRRPMAVTAFTHPFSHPSFTPLMPIEKFNRDTGSGIFIRVDLAGDFGNRRDVTESRVDNGNDFSAILNFKEFLTLADLQQDQGMSDLTRRFKQRRTQNMGAESNIAKLVDVEIDSAARHITFKWLTDPSAFEYPPDYEYKEVDPETKRLMMNRSKTYELWIRILDFFDWLDTYPDKEEIASSDIKDVFDIANVQVWSTDPSWWYQGISYWATQLDASILPNKITPQRWNADNLHGDGNAFLSKHLQSLINGIKFWYGPMASMLTKRLKDGGYL